jgi:hypothetical protein
VPLVELLGPLEIPLAPRPEVPPACVRLRVLVIPPTVEICVASNEQQIVVTTDVRSCIRGLAHTPAEMPPILVVYLAGRLFLNDGHHRLVASRMLGVPVRAEVHGLPAAPEEPQS